MINIITFRISENMNYIIKFRKYIIMGLLLILNGISFAGSHSTVILKNGSVINGDIIVQRPGKDLTIESEKAILIIKPEDIVSNRDRTVKYDDLSREWKRWVLENRTLKGDAYGRYAVMEDIKTTGYTFSGVMKKPEDGKISYTYYQVSSTTFNIKWNDIQEIKKDIHENEYNLIDEVTTFNGKIYEGKIASQRPGKDLTIDTGKSQIQIKSKFIKEIRKRKQKNAGSYFDQTDYVNVVCLSNGKEKEGLIILNHYGNKAKDNFITLVSKNGTEEKIRFSDMSELRTKYQKADVAPYHPGKVYLNEFRIEKAKIQRENGNIVFKDKKVFPFPEGLTMEFKSVDKKFISGWSLILLSEVTLNNGKTSWGYNPSIRNENIIQPKSQDSQSSLTSIKFGYLSPGYYALVNEDDTESYVFKITK